MIQRKSNLILLGTGYIVLMILAWYFVSTQFFQREVLQAIMSELGFFSPIVFFFVELIYIILVPVYNTPIHLFAGYIYGAYWGFLLNYITTTLGLFFIVWLSQKYGRSILEKIIHKKALARFDTFFGKQTITPFLLLVIYVLPLFPDDEITYLVALSKIPFKKFIPAILLGNISKAAVSFIGNNPIEGIIPAILFRVAILGVGVLFYFRRRIFASIRS